MSSNTTDAGFEAWAQDYYRGLQRDIAKGAWDAATAAERVRCAVEVRNESELPDEMPDEMFEYMTRGRDEMSEALRAVVRETKLGILSRIEVNE